MPLGLQLDGQRLASRLGANTGQGLVQVGTAARIFPVVSIKAVMKAATAGCEPHFMQGCLTVDDDLVAVFKNQVQNVAVSLGFHIQIKLFEPVVRLGFYCI